MDDPGSWAKAAEEAGADLIELMLSLTDTDGNPTTPEAAVAAVKAVLPATGLPLIVFGPGQAELDNALLVPLPKRPRASAWCWASAKTRITAPSWPLPWQTATWSAPARRWMSTWPSS